jgi:alpha-1,6-mannosyltransferase
VLLRGAAGSTLLVLGGYAYVRLPRETWMDRVPLLWSVRAMPHHVACGLATSALGLALLTWAWWDLGRRARTNPHGLALVRRATAVWVLPLLLAPPLFSGDGWSYVATGDLAGHGRSPYLWTPASLPVPLRSGVAPVWQFTPSPYGPLSLAWGGIFSRVTRDPWALLAWYRLAAVLALVLLAWAVPRVARRAGRDPVEASVLAVASPFTLAHGIGGLHNDLVTVGLAMAGLALTRPRRWLAGALLVGAAASVKAPGAVAAVGVVLLSLPSGASWLARLGRSTVVGAVVTAVVVATGWLTGLGLGWVQALAVPDHEQTVLSVSAVIGRFVRGLLRRAGPGGVRVVHEVHPELLSKRIGLVLLVVIALWVLLRSPLEPRRASAMTGVVLLAAVVLSPVVHYWYFFWCVPLLACVPWRRATDAALVAGIATLGLTAVGDRALRVQWLWEGSAWGLLLVPAGVWAVTAATAATAARPISAAGSWPGSRERAPSGDWRRTRPVGLPRRSRRRP